MDITPASRKAAKMAGHISSSSRFFRVVNYQSSSLLFSLTRGIRGLPSGEKLGMAEITSSEECSV